MVYAAQKPCLIYLLLVEDNLDEIELCRKLLPGVGRSLNVEIKLEVARNGEQALNYLRALNCQRPDLILLDLRMPIMSGHDFLSVLRESPVWRRLPVCVLTTSPDTADVCRAYDSFCNAYVIKPLGASELQRVLTEVIGFFTQVNTLPSHE